MLQNIAEYCIKMQYFIVFKRVLQFLNRVIINYIAVKK